jgi:hypothetical protein
MNNMWFLEKRKKDIFGNKYEQETSGEIYKK